MRIKDLTEGEFSKGFAQGLGTDTGFGKAVNTAINSHKKKNPLDNIDTRGLKLILRDLLRGEKLTPDQMQTVQSVYSKL